MNINQIIIDVMVFFMVVAALDRCIGSKFGLGDKLDEALDTIGPMCIPMVGMILLAPLIGEVLGPSVGRFFELLGADPAMFAGAILSCDMGGYPLAVSMAKDPAAGQFSGCILGCSLGGVVSFLLPVGITMVKKELHSYFTIGVLVGVVTIPLGMIAGGLAAGYSVSMVLHNTLPVLLIAAVIAVGLWKVQGAMIRIFTVFGRLLSAVAMVGFAIGIIQELTSIVIIEDLTSVLDGVKVVGSVAIVLCGAYPMLELMKRAFGGGLKKLGGVLHIDENAMTGIIGGFANIMPVLGTCNQMSPAGVLVSIAFAVSGVCMFGDHLGYIASVDKSMIVPMIVSKLVGAVTAVILAVIVCKKQGISAELARNKSEE